MSKVESFELLCFNFFLELFCQVSSDRLNAFDSPNFSPLASLGINIELDRSNLLKQTKAPFQLSTALNRNVALLRLYPSITAQTVKAFLQAPMEGVVLQTYGKNHQMNSHQKQRIEVWRVANFFFLHFL